ncbi:uncharacterized protein LOC119431655 [Dermacentor silvarum]|uniref:uncharacterized protein LOC119431655 n=1 Tax=Dermacentor silvarum TaxID=543639 RepID=UPI00210093D3|nr:uncharacterized protein LOC119431655 [Dermacentor silvarum]
MHARLIVSANLTVEVTVQESYGLGRTVVEGGNRAEANISGHSRTKCWDEHPTTSTTAPEGSSTSPGLKDGDSVSAAPGEGDEDPSEPQPLPIKKVTTELPPYKPYRSGARSPVYQGTFRPCSSHEDCQPDECCVYGLSRGDSCVKHFKPCPVIKVPVRPRPRFCPPYNSGGFFFNVCSAPEDCPYPYLCCRLRGSYMCVPSFYDRRRRRRRHAIAGQRYEHDDDDDVGASKWHASVAALSS